MVLTHEHTGKLGMQAVLNETNWGSQRIPNIYSYGPLPVISTYNPIYRMYNPTYNQLKLVNGHNCNLGELSASCVVFALESWRTAAWVMG